jgi:predicted component of viral defense system (DUF524 family)
VIAHDPVSGVSAKLIPQRAYHRRGEPLRSASYEQRPDIAIEIEQPGRLPRALVFDPKYKLESEELEGEITDGRPKKVDVDKMHAYRDAIRDSADEHAVEFAAIIYPGSSSETYGEGLEAIAARPGSAAPSAISRILSNALRGERTARAAA